MTYSTPDRNLFIAAFKGAIVHELDALDRVSSVTREEVTSRRIPLRGQIRYLSHRGFLSSRGQAMRIAQLRQLVAWVATLTAAPPSREVVCLGSLVLARVRSNAHYFVAPAGGSRISLDGHTVRVVSQIRLWDRATGRGGGR